MKVKHNVYKIKKSIGNKSGDSADHSNVALFLSTCRSLVSKILMKMTSLEG